MSRSIEKEQILKTFTELVTIPSKSLEEREVADYLKKELSTLGLEVTEDNAGEKYNGNAGNVIGVLKGNDEENKKTILFSAHMDTVVPCQKINVVMDGDTIKTDGTSILGGDDKSGITAILEALKIIVEEEKNGGKHPTIIVVFSIAEEIGLLGAKEVEIEKYGVDFGYILDSGGDIGVVDVEAPSHIDATLKIIGTPAHAGVEPEKGINALTVAAHAITKIKLGRIDEMTTSNIGQVSGGVATNIVMPEIELKYEARSLEDSKVDALVDETIKTIQEVCDSFGAKFEYKVNKGYQSFKVDENSAPIIKFKEVCNKLGIKAQLESTGGGSDTNVYNTKNIPCVNLSTGMENVHTTEEYIKLSDIVKITEVVLELMK